MVRPIPFLFAASAFAAPVDFAREVYPILESRCHSCHGAKAQLGGLRLDAAGALRKGGKSGPAVKPGSSRESRLFEKITKGEMPPTRDKLGASEIAALGRWIDEGATWPAGVGSKEAPVELHWSYKAPVRPALPEIADARWNGRAIDRFVHARLAAEGMRPAPEASRETLLRRLSLDLTGLPPSIAEIDTFLADRAANAYEKQVDRLLRSPRFGERWAHWWLALARYADTNGYESDEPRSNWPWRDWVIRAFNANIPFDRFTIEQIAGDLLPDRTEDQLIATGFHRNTLINSEAGSKDDEFRDAAVKDRLETTGTIWLGSTIGCAQCHDHKYDPFTRADYYRLYAFFNSTAESAIQLDQEHRVFHGGKAKLNALRAAMDAPRKILDTPTPALSSALKEWEREMAAAAPRVSASWSRIGAGKERVIEVRNPAPLTGLRVTEPAETVEAWSAEEIEEEREAGTLVWSDWFQSPVFEAESPQEAHATAWAPEKQSAPGPDWRKRTDLPDGAFYQLDGYNCSVYLSRTVTAPRARRARIGVASNQGVKVFLNGRPVFASAALEAVDPDKGAIALDLRAGENRVLLKYTNGPGYYRYYFKKFAGSGRKLKAAETSADKKTLLFDTPVRAARLRIGFARLPKEEAVVESSAAPFDALAFLARLPEGLKTDADKLASYYRWNSPLLARTRREHDRAKAAYDDYFAKNSAATLVMRELDKPRDTHMQARGNFLAKGEPVTPAVPAIFTAPAAGSGRLDLARWMVSRGNPLAARVLANHVWRAIFATGLVKTADDFGAQGERPTHPELLDWLAVEWMERGWDFRWLVKEIAMSETYRQSSAAAPDALARDPANRLLGRGSRYRLGAEPIRDVTLAAAGLLSAKLGGPSVFPPLPKSVFESLFIESGIQTWPASSGEDRYRRGMYTFYKRAAPYPASMTFDAPERVVCTVDRPRSNTPLQALTALNDEAFVEAARALAGRMRGATAADRAILGFRLATGRRPYAKELASILTLLERTAAKYRADPAAARKLSPSAPDLAPWVVAANVLLNLDETVTRE